MRNAQVPGKGGVILTSNCFPVLKVLEPGYGVRCLVGWLVVFLWGSLRDVG